MRVFGADGGSRGFSDPWKKADDQLQLKIDTRRSADVEATDLAVDEAREREQDAERLAKGQAQPLRLTNPPPIALDERHRASAINRDKEAIPEGSVSGGRFTAMGHGGRSDPSAQLKPEQRPLGTSKSGMPFHEGGNPHSFFITVA